MFGKKKEKDIVASARPLRSMTEKDRRRYIEDLEEARAEVVREIEEIMFEAAPLTRKKAMKHRKYKLGKAPNDWKKK